MQSKVVPQLFFKTISYILNYISYGFFTFVVCEFIAIFLMGFTQTPIEETFFWLVAHTPTLGRIWGTKSFQLGKEEIIQFVAFWSFILLIVNQVIQKSIKTKIYYQIYLIINSIFHCLAFLRFLNNSDLLVIIVAFYLLSIISFFLYRGFNRISKMILKIPSPS